MTELKPCPFCGKDMQKHDSLGHDEHAVYCNNCGAIGPNEITQKNADEMWNLRRPEDALRARIAKLEASNELMGRVIEDAVRLIESAIDDRCSWCLGRDGQHEDDCEAYKFLNDKPQPLPTPPEAQS